MGTEGSVEPPDADFVIQNRTGGAQHATVRCQTSTSTIFSEMVELGSGETATYESLPQELIELQVSVADGPKGSKMYDAETVSGSVVVGLGGSGVVFETADAVGSVSGLDDIFDDGGIGTQSAETASAPPTDDPGEPDDDAAEPTRDTSETGASSRTGGTASDPDTTDSANRDPSSGGSTRTANTDDAGSASTDASGAVDRRSTGSEPAGGAGADAAGRTESETSSGGDRRESGGRVDRTSGPTAGTDSSDGRASEPSDGRASEPSATTPSTDEGGPGPDEIHCRNCGEIIRQRAEICPECGEQNAVQPDRQTGQAADADNTNRRSGAESQPESSTRSATDDGEAGPGPDEIYCRNCGDVIRQRAEICPECGVQNSAQAGGGQSTGAQSAQRSQQAGRAGAQAQVAGAAGAPNAQGRPAGSGTSQPQQGGSTAGGASRSSQARSSRSEPSGSWVNGVRFGALLWLLALLILVPTILQYQNVTAGSGVDPGGMLRSLGLATLLPPVQLLAWVVLPLSLYFDLKYVDYHVDEWPLSGRLYIAAALILPVLTQIFGAAALFLGSGGVAVAAVVPVLLLALSIRHLRTRSRLV